MASACSTTFRRSCSPNRPSQIDGINADANGIFFAMYKKFVVFLVVFNIFRTDRRTDGPTDGRTDGRPDGRTDGRPDGRADGRKDGRTADRRTDGPTDGRTDGRPAGRPDGRTEGPMDRRTDRRTGGWTDGPYVRLAYRPCSCNQIRSSSMIDTGLVTEWGGVEVGGGQ